MPIAEFEKAKIWTSIHSIESSALDQIKNAMHHPRLFKHLAIMPDVHTGIGCTIGAVLPIENALIPSSVGVDIGCGMCAVKSDLKLNKIKSKFDYLHEGIINRIPLGFSHRNQTQMKDYNNYITPLFKEKIEAANRKYKNNAIAPQLGTLGGGNHFIELQIDSEQNVWVMLHSGSRNIGNLIASTAINLAKQLKDKKEKVPRDLEYLDVSSKEGETYLAEMRFAQDFALHNRFLMMKIIQEELAKLFPEISFDDIINIHHNYADLETHFGKQVWVHRKGATKAVSDQLGIIPGSMGTASYIVRGKNNPESFNSCSHGAGRLMSRSAAKGKYDRKSGKLKTAPGLSLEQFEEDMRGIYSRDVNRTHLDEAPRAYKPINEVLENQKDLIDIEVELKPVFNIKG